MVKLEIHGDIRDDEECRRTEQSGVKTDWVSLLFNYLIQIELVLNIWFCGDDIYYTW